MKNFFLLFIILSVLTSCQSVKDGLTGKKQNNSDEFLVKKKNPLVLPPDYGKLPTPDNSKKVKETKGSSEIESLLKKKEILKEGKKLETKKSSVEEFVLEKIKNK
tara:strand:- start:845 stop:1159 length:315 start_codon:yes stop_codon:yes gene_type:complete